MYQIVCECGSPIEVKLAHAGLDLPCPCCGKSNRVPPASQLKKLAPQSTGSLKGFRQTLEVLQTKSPPFDGNCALCKTRIAEYSLPLKFDFLLEHHLDDDGGIQTVPPYFILKKENAVEKWGHLFFPLNFCQSCHDQFQHEWKAARKKRRPRKLLLWCLVSPLVLLSMIIAALVPVLSTPMVMFAVYFIYRRFTRRKGDPFLIEKLKSMPPVSIMLSEEADFHLKSKSTKLLTPGQ